jgi:hypothetical protein
MAVGDLELGRAFRGQRTDRPEGEEDVDLNTLLRLRVGEGQRRQRAVVGLVANDDGELLRVGVSSGADAVVRPRVMRRDGGYGGQSLFGWTW